MIGSRKMILAVVVGLLPVTLFLVSSLAGAPVLATVRTPAAITHSAYPDDYILIQETMVDFSDQSSAISDPERNLIYINDKSKIIVINARTGATVAIISDVILPDKMAINPEQMRLYVSSEVGYEQDGRITVIDTTSHTVINVFAYPFVSGYSYSQNLQAIAVDSTGKLYLAPHILGGNPYGIDVMDGHTGEMLPPIPLGQASINYRLAVSGSKLYVSRGGFSTIAPWLFKYDVAGEQPVLEIDSSLAFTPQNLVPTSDDSFLLIRSYGSTLLQYDSETLAESYNYSTNNNAYYHNVAISADNQHIHGHYSGMNIAVHTFDPVSHDLVRVLKRKINEESGYLLLPLEGANFAVIYSDSIRAFTPVLHALSMPLVLMNYCASPFLDSFDDPASGWPIADTGAVLYRYIDGEYNIHHRHNNSWTAVTRGDRIESYEWGKSSQARISGRVAEMDGVWGLLFGLNDEWTSFYTFEILPYDRVWVILKFTSGSGWSLIHHGTSEKIHWGTAVNTLSFTTGWDQMTFYINGASILSTGPRSGRIGLTGGSFDSYTDIRYDDYGFSANECPPLNQAMTHRSLDTFTTIERPSPATFFIDEE
jgi:hypothetical protein